MLNIFRRISRTVSCRTQQSNCLKLTVFLCSTILLAGICIDQLVGIGIYHRYRNFYRHEVIRPITVVRSSTNNGRTEIVLLVVVANRSNAEDYRLSQDSMRCYAKFHGYQLLEVDISQNDSLQRICPQKDFMFQRHCITVQILNGLPSSSWLLFIDADIGIINPNRLIEEYLDLSVDLIFYDRTFNFEIMAGSYLTRKTNFSLQFLQYWANYEFHLPNSVHGTDNGAIQMVFMDLLLPSLQFSEREKCARIWEKSRDYHDLFVFEACARRVLAPVNGSWPGRVKVLAKGEAWCRDGWLTSSMWSPGDFMFHGWQKRRMDRLEFAGWPSPFVSNVFNMSLCDTNQAYKNWRYKDSFIQTTNEIEQVLTREKALANRDYRRALAEIHWKPFDLNDRSW